MLGYHLRPEYAHNIYLSLPDTLLNVVRGFFSVGAIRSIQKLKPKIRLRLRNQRPLNLRLVFEEVHTMSRRSSSAVTCFAEVKISKDQIVPEQNVGKELYKYVKEA